MAKSPGDGQSERLHMRISRGELTVIDDWRYANRVSTRSDAVRRLAQIGIVSSQSEELISSARDNFLSAFDELDRNIQYGFDRSKNCNLGKEDDLHHVIYDIAWEFTEFMLSVGVLIDRIDAFGHSISTLKSEGSVDEAVEISRIKFAELRDRSNKLSMEVERIRKGETGPNP